MSTDTTNEFCNHGVIYGDDARCILKKGHRIDHFYQPEGFRYRSILSVNNMSKPDRVHFFTGLEALTRSILHELRRLDSSGFVEYTLELGKVETITKTFGSIGKNSLCLLKTQGDTRLCVRIKGHGELCCPEGYEYLCAIAYLVGIQKWPDLKIQQFCVGIYWALEILKSSHSPDSIIPENVVIRGKNIIEADRQAKYNAMWLEGELKIRAREEQLKPSGRTKYNACMDQYDFVASKWLADELKLRAREEKLKPLLKKLCGAEAYSSRDLTQKKVKCSLMQHGDTTPHYFPDLINEKD